MRRSFPSGVIAAVLLLTHFPAGVAGGSVLLQRDRASGLFQTNESIVWRAIWQAEGEEDNPPADARFTFLLGGATEVLAGNIHWPSCAEATLGVKLTRPDAVLLEVRWTDDKGAEQVVRSGAVAAPDQITPAAEAPDDFDEFWESKLAELRGVPVNARLTPTLSAVDGVDTWHVTMDNIRGTRIRGQLALPSGNHSLPALLVVQWAGVYGLQSSWATDRAEEGWLTLNILPHDIPISEGEDYYREQDEGDLRNYPQIGNDDRENSYFLRMYLSCYRAVEYLRSRPDWNGKTLVVMGTSQGGQQAFVTAGLHPEITAALALVPAGADMLAPTIGRAPAYPYWYRNTEGRDAEAVHEASRYFDIANFAQRIRAPMLVGVGLRDTSCPPATVYAAINRIHGHVEVVPLPDSGHQDENHSQRPYHDRAFHDWLPALRDGLGPPGMEAQCPGEDSLSD